MIKKLQIDLNEKQYTSLKQMKEESWKTLKFMLLEAVKEYIEKNKN